MLRRQIGDCIASTTDLPVDRADHFTDITATMVPPTNLNKLNARVRRSCKASWTFWVTVIFPAFRDWRPKAKSIEAAYSWPIVIAVRRAASDSCVFNPGRPRIEPMHPHDEQAKPLRFHRSDASKELRLTSGTVVPPLFQRPGETTYPIRY